MKFNSPRTIENIHLIYQLMIKESKTAGDIALDMCCSKPLIYLYLRHMEMEGYCKTDGNLNKVFLYKAIPGVNLPPLTQPETDDDEIDIKEKKKLKAKFSKIVPFRDEWLFSLFGVK